MANDLLELAYTQTVTAATTTTATTASGAIDRHQHSNRPSDGAHHDSKAGGNEGKSAIGAGNNRQIGHYIVGRSLGQGTFGKVRLGTHILTGEKVAIKILEKDKIKDQSDVERVTREIHILKIVRHPNVIQLYEIIETSKQLFLIMEYANGGELFDYIVKRKRLQEPEACKFFHQIISGVEYIHRVRICHRDLKPENLLLDDKNNIKIVDFGLSNTYREGEMLKTACGSPCYAAPEMIAGKRYQGLISDVWSCGIILYAMSCGYLPFEDPNTNKLYKKILNCDYLIPGFISSTCKDLTKKILNTDPVHRYTMKDIRSHEWFNQIKSVEMEGILVGKENIPIIDEAIQNMIRDSGCSSEDPNFYNQAVVYIQNNKHNQVTSTYYLILKKLERETGRNYVFEQAQKDKKKYANSTGNLSTVNFTSPHQNSYNKISAPAKIMMNQTALVSSGLFNRAGPQVSNKSSDGKVDLSQSQGVVITHHNHNFSTSNPQSTKKYLDSVERFNTKRTDGVVQQSRPTTDSITSCYNQLNILASSGNIERKSETQQVTNHYSTQANGVRVNQTSLSPNSRILNAAHMQSNVSAGATINGQQTFYMAERLKKNQISGAFHQKNNNHVRHGSVDDNTGIIIQSTNDSRVEEMLPNVVQQQQQQRQNTKSVQMRSTMYNNSYFQKLINNVQGVSAVNSINKTTIISNSSNAKEQANLSLNIVDMKKKVSTTSTDISPPAAQNNTSQSNGGSLANSIMIKTSYGGINSNAQQQQSYLINAIGSLNSTVISKALAQQKLRKIRQTNQIPVPQIRNNSQGEGGPSPIMNFNEHSFSQELTQTSSDPLNTTSGDIIHHKSNIDTLLANKNQTQKKIDSNMFTVYRTKKQQQKGATNRLEGTINEQQDYTGFSSGANTGQTEMQFMNQQQTPLTSTLSRFYNNHGPTSTQQQNINKQHYRLLSNQYNPPLPHSITQHKQNQQIPVFQNNFVLPNQIVAIGQQQQFHSLAQKTVANGFYSSVSAKHQPNQSMVITNHNSTTSGSSPRMGVIQSEAPGKVANSYTQPHVQGSGYGQIKGEVRVKLMNGTQNNFNASPAVNNKRIVIL